MSTFADKSQKPQDAAQAKCPTCGGEGKVKNAQGKDTRCHRCMGTGKGGGYMTK